MNKKFKKFVNRRMFQAEDRIDNLKNKSEVEKIRLEHELIKEREKSRNLSSILVQRELESKNDQLEKKNLKLLSKLKSLSERNRKETIEVQTQTISERFG